jgi:hypothetical protein
MLISESESRGNGPRFVSTVEDVLPQGDGSDCLWAIAPHLNAIVQVHVASGDRVIVSR